MKSEQPDLFDLDNASPSARKKSAPSAAGADDAPPPPRDGRKGTVGQGEGPLRDLIDSNFLQYASYVIRDRAIPDLDDGLKPVQRRILWSLWENDDKRFIKVANIVGHTMQYHPHGDASIGDALVTLVNRGYLIEGQGNFGNIHTGDPAAASRYIECRLTELARTQLFNEELTEFIPSYDGRKKEPVILPCKLPLVLMLGAEGIAVGLSTRILPHNFAELLEAQIAILEKKPFEIFPDFQQGGLMDVSEYARGNGKIKLRAVIEPRGKDTVVIREIPYGTTTESLVASIEDAARKKKIQIRSLHDFTAESVEIEIKLSPKQDPETAIQALYAFTQCEVPYSASLVLIHRNRPVEMDVDSVLRHCTERLTEILKLELEAEQRHLEDAFHRKTLVQIFVENRIYKDIEEKDTQEAVRKAVRKGVETFRDQLKRDIAEEDIDMLLAVPIRRISLFDINQHRQEIGDILDRLKQIAKDLKRMRSFTIRYLKDLLKTYGKLHPRRTRIEAFEAVAKRELAAETLELKHDPEKMFLGYGVSGEPKFTCSSLDKIVLIWKDGKYRVMPPPEQQFVDSHLERAAVYDRDKVYTLVYQDGPIAYLKRFTLGGAIMNKDYQCAPEGAKILFLDDTDPEVLYVKYRKQPRLRITQQEFHPREQAVRTARAKGVQMTAKTITSVGTSPPRSWDHEESGPKGRTV